MARRKVHEETRGKFSVKIYWDPDYQEYNVIWYIGKISQGEGYFTDDKADAIATAEADLDRLMMKYNPSPFGYVATVQNAIRRLKTLVPELNHEARKEVAAVILSLAHLAEDLQAAEEDNEY